MDRNSIFGILLIAAILIVWGIFQTPGKKELEARKKYADSLYQAQLKELQKADSAEALLAPDASKTEGLTDDSIAASRRFDQYGAFAASATGTKEFYTIENDVMKMVVSTKGGRPYSVELKKYKTFWRDPVVLFNGDSTQFGLTFYEQNRPISTNELYFVPSEIKDSSIVMRLAVNENRYIEYRYQLKPADYMVDFSIHLAGMKDIVTRDPSAIDMNWEVYIPQVEQEKKYENQYTSIYYRHHQEDVDFFKPRQNKEVHTEDIPTRVQWVAFKSQFFSSIILSDNAFSGALLKSTNLPETDKYLKNFSAELGIPFQRLETETLNLKLFFGPNKFKLLKTYGDYDLENIVSVGRGLIRMINQYLIIPVFDWLSKFIGNFGIIILVLTIIIKILLLPLTYKSYLSQASMRVLKPQIDELAIKYPKGKEMERQQATMALYKKAGISPLGGCLPMLLQFPILFAMFRFFPTSIELRQEGFLWATDLSTYDSILSWEAQIPILSSLYGNHVSLFTLLMTISTIIQMKMSDTAGSTQQMPGMKSMMYIMPVMFMFILNNFSAGLTYYYFLTNIITIGQNYLFKQLVDEKEILRKIEERKAKPVKKSKWQQRLEEMSKRQQMQKKPVKAPKSISDSKKPVKPGQNQFKKSQKGRA